VLVYVPCARTLPRALSHRRRRRRRRYWTLTRNITAKKGLAGTLDGFVPWGMLQAVAKGAVFSWGQAQSMELLRPVDFMSKEQKTVASGGESGRPAPCHARARALLARPRHSSAPLLFAPFRAARHGRLCAGHRAVAAAAAEDARDD
jgi:hypothetical protein